MNRLQKHSHSAMWVIIVALLILWGFGIFTVGNGPIHLLLVVALVVFIVQIVTGRLRQ